jgi:hypothetical protein
MKTTLYSVLLLFICSCNHPTPKENQTSSETEQKDLETDSVPLSYEDMKSQLEKPDSSQWVSVNDVLRTLHPKKKKADPSYIHYLSGEELLETYSQFYQLLNSNKSKNNNPTFRKVYTLLDKHLEYLNENEAIHTQEVLKITSIKSDINTWFANSTVKEYTEQ